MYFFIFDFSPGLKSEGLKVEKIVLVLSEMFLQTQLHSFARKRSHKQEVVFLRSLLRSAF